MANSLDDAMARLERLESDVGEIKGCLVQIVTILLGQSERLDAGLRATRELRESTRELHESTRELHESSRELQLSMVERLDRLIEVTLRDRTQNVERLGDVERRLTRLEEHVGIPRS
jgi:hypothetical protein